MNRYVDSSSNGRASDCGSGGCEFDSHLSTQRGGCALASSTDCKSAVLDCAGSTPALPTTNRKSNEYRQNNVVVNRDSNRLLVIVYL